MLHLNPLQFFTPPNISTFHLLRNCISTLPECRTETHTKILEHVVDTMSATRTLARLVAGILTAASITKVMTTRTAALLRRPVICIGMANKASKERLLSRHLHLSVKALHRSYLTLVIRAYQP